MIKKFRAWDGKGYWYANDDLLFTQGSEVSIPPYLPFKLKDLEMYIGKNDSKGVMIYENDLIKSTLPEVTKIFQVVWSDDECGFRKIPHDLPYPETKIDEAFMEVIGTIHS